MTSYGYIRRLRTTEHKSSKELTLILKGVRVTGTSDVFVYDMKDSEEWYTKISVMCINMNYVFNTLCCIGYIALFE